MLLFLLLLMATQPVSLTITPRFQHAPGSIHVQVRVEPHADNRHLTVSIDGERYYRSTAEDLEGDKARITRDWWFEGLPAGAYKALATLVRNDGQRRFSGVTFCVAGAEAC